MENNCIITPTAKAWKYIEEQVLGFGKPVSLPCCWMPLGTLETWHCAKPAVKWRRAGQPEVELWRSCPWETLSGSRRGESPVWDWLCSSLSCGWALGRRWIPCATSSPYLVNIAHLFSRTFPGVSLEILVCPEHPSGLFQRVHGSASTAHSNDCDLHPSVCSTNSERALSLSDVNSAQRLPNPFLLLGSSQTPNSVVRSVL